MTYNHSEFKWFIVFFIVISYNELVLKKILFTSVSVYYGCSQNPGYYEMEIHNNNTWLWKTQLTPSECKLINKNLVKVYCYYLPPLQLAPLSLQAIARNTFMFSDK